MVSGSKKTWLALVGALTVYLAVVALASGQAPAPPRPPMAEEVFKNIQVLKGIPADEFLGTMGFFSAALGLNCTDCHVGESGGSWEKYADDNALKQMTRRMVLMVDSLNRANFGGRQVITCNTCHRGTNKPNVMPSLDALYGPPAADEPGDPFVPAPGGPSAEALLDKFIAAIGGAQRAASLTSFVAKGTYLGFDDAEKVPVEIFARAPGHRTTIVHGPLGVTTTTVDGHSGWIAAPLIDKPVPVLEVTGQELEGIKFEAELWFPSRINEGLTNWRAGMPAVLDDRDIQLVQGHTPGGAVVTLCFDAETGLLTRLVRYAESPVGRLVSRIDYRDYREVAGIKMPFQWTVTWLSGRSVFELTDVKPNVAIEATRFAKPRG